MLQPTCAASGAREHANTLAVLGPTGCYQLQEENAAAAVCTLHLLRKQVRFVFTSVYFPVLYMPMIMRVLIVTE